ncbi:MAG: hypothetical protein Q4G58_00825 [bacterium]|nr:hypothetical protein [bacterium]
MQYDNNFISGRNFFGLELAEVKNIKGFRKSGRIARKYSIPVGKSNYLDLIMNDGTIVSLAFFHEYEVTHAIDILKKEYPSMTEYKTYVH